MSTFARGARRRACRCAPPAADLGIPYSILQKLETGGRAKAPGLELVEPRRPIRPLVVVAQAAHPLVGVGLNKGHYAGCLVAFGMKSGERAWRVLGEWPPKPSLG